MRRTIINMQEAVDKTRGYTQATCKWCNIFDFARLITLTPHDCPEALDAIDALRNASLAMMRDILRSDAKQPKLLMNELFGV